MNARSSGGNGRCGRLIELDFILGERLCAIYLDALSAQPTSVAYELRGTAGYLCS